MAASEYHNPAKAKDSLFDMFLAYVKDPDFGNLSAEQRIEAVNIASEIKNTMTSEQKA